MRRLFSALTLAAVLSACGQPKDIAIDGGWVRLAAAPGRPAAAYFKLTGGATDATLVSVTSPVAVRSELHESMKMGQNRMGGMTMRPLDQLALPAGATLNFAPGGKHVMLFDMNPGVKPGGKVPLEFTFADGTKRDYDARAVAAGDPPPQS